MSTTKRYTPYRKHVSRYDLSSVGTLPEAVLAKFVRDEPLSGTDEALLEAAMQQRMAELRALRLEHKRDEPNDLRNPNQPAVPRPSVLRRRTVR